MKDSAKERILDTLVEHVVYQDREMRIQWANRAAADSAGLTREQLIGRHCYEIWPETNEPCADCPVIRAMTTGQPQQVEKSTPDGRTWFIRGYPVEDDEGTITGGIEVTLDITGSKATEERLHECEDIVNRGPAMVFLWRVMPGEWPVEFVSRNVERVLGYTADDFISGRVSWPGIMHPDDVPRLEVEAAQRLNEGCEEWSQEYRLITKSGEVRWFRDRNLSLADASGRVTRIQGIVLDVTERRNAEEALRYRLDYEELVAGISSDFVNMAIKDVDAGITRTLERAGRLSEVDRSYVILLHDESTRMSQVYEWCADGIRSNREQMRGLEVNRFPWMIEELTERGIVNMPCVRDLPDEADALKEALEAAEVRSLLIAPVIIAGKLIGFLGFSVVRGQRTWSSAEVSLVKIVAEVFANALERKRVTDALEERLAFETLLSDLSATFVRLPIAKIDREIERWLERIGEFLDIDRGTLVRSSDATGDIEITHAWAASGLARAPARLPRSAFGWFLEQLRMGEIVAFSRAEEAPQEAASEKEYCRQQGMKSVLVVPLAVERSTLGAVVFSSVREHRAWSDEMVQRLRLVGEIFANALLRARAIEALQREHDVVSRVMETSPAGIVLVNRSGRITLANACAETILGLARDEITQRSYNAPEWHITDYEGNPFPDEDLPFSRVLQTGQAVHDVRYAIERPDGTRLLLRVNAAPVFGESGEMDGMVAAIEDVTETVESETALRESEERFRSIFENAVLGLYQTAPDGRILMANAALVRMLGYASFEGLAERNVEKDGYHEGYYRSDFKKRIEAEGRVVGMESGWTKRDGTPLFVRENARAVRDEHGRVLYYEGTVEDVTERKRAEWALQESKAKLQSIFDSSPYAITVTDLDGTVVECNQATLDMHGVRRKSDMLGCSAFDLIAAEDLPRARQNMERTLHIGWVRDVQYLLLRDDGTTFPVELSASVIRDASGQPMGFVGITTDITERKRAEDALHESEERFRELADLLPQTIFEMDAEGNFTYANQAGLETFGCASEDIHSLNVLQLFVPEDRVRIRQNVAKKLAGEPFQDHEYCALRRDGHTFPVLLYSSPILRGGRPVGLRGIVLDMTERKQAEEALRRSEKKYRALYEGSRDGTAVTDLEGRILDCNTVFAEMLGYDKDEITKLTVYDITPPEWMAREESIIYEQVYTRGYSDVFEKEYVRKGGSVFPAELRVYLNRDSEGKPLGTWAVVRDISERKRAEVAAQEHLAELTRAWHANTLGEMATGLAHELNQPLCAILNYSNSCLRMARREDLSVDVMNSSLEQIVGQAERAADIVKRIRSLVGKHEPRRTSLDVNGVVTDAIDMVRNEAARQNVVLVSRLAQHLPVIKGDAVEIEQVVLNLVRNAIEAMSDPNVTERRLTVSTSLTPENGVEVAVADTGRGFSTELSEKVFDSFFTTKHQGLGVGLSLSRRIVEVHGGRLWAESDGTSGATFKLTLPA